MPRAIPDVRNPAFSHGVAADEIVKLLSSPRGAPFCLFTSYSQMNICSSVFAAAFVSFVAAGHCAAIGAARTIQDTQGAVLFATSKFLARRRCARGSTFLCHCGSPALRVPSDPIVCARVKACRRMGATRFSEFQVPQRARTEARVWAAVRTKKTDRGRARAAR